MKIIEIRLKSQFQPQTFENVEEFYDHLKTIEIVQLDLYQTTRTIINKSSLDYYKIIETP